MSQTWWNLLVWGTFGLGFFLREIPALLQKSPWVTLSEVLWDVQADWRPAVGLMGLGLAWLTAHILAKFIV